jgi:glycosyltransferase involved in cell wall biosynthesis
MGSFAYLFERFPSFVQTFCYREAEEMARQGMEPLVLSIRRPNDPPELAEKLELETLYLPEEKELRAEVDRRREAGQLPRAVKKAIARHRSEPDSQRLFEAVWIAPLLRQRGIRHVHAHFGGMAARTAYWLRQLYNFRYSFTGHANDIFCENDFPVSNADLVREATFIVTETDYARRWMEEKYHFARGRVFRVFNGIDTSGFHARLSPAEVPRILSVGRYVEKKGFADLIEACRLLHAQGQRFECFLVGGGPLEEDLRGRIVAAGLEGLVHLLGPRPQHEVRTLLASADLFVLACVPDAGGGSDNLPTVIMEAMAGGVPCVSTRLAGVPEMIEHRENGWLVSPGAPAELCEAMCHLLTNPFLLRKLGEAGQAVAHRKFAVSGSVRELKHLLVHRSLIPSPKLAQRLDPEIEVSPFAQFFRNLRQ